MLEPNDNPINQPKTQNFSLLHPASEPRSQNQVKEQETKKLPTTKKPKTPGRHHPSGKGFQV
jgi:hypothetical protein